VPALAALEEAEAAVERAQVPQLGHQSRRELLAEQRVEEDEPREDAVGDDQG
jgi:hypothetical protein